MEALISEACRRPIDDIRNVQYDLEGPEGELILPSTWELTIQAGWTISIRFVEQTPNTLSDDHSAHLADRVQKVEDQIVQQEERIFTWQQEGQRQQRECESVRARLDEQVALPRGSGRDKAGSSQGNLCSISPLICWLSGKRRTCNQR